MPDASSQTPHTSQLPLETKEAYWLIITDCISHEKILDHWRILLHKEMNDKEKYDLALAVSMLQGFIPHAETLKEIPFEEKEHVLLGFISKMYPIATEIWKKLADFDMKLANAEDLGFPTDFTEEDLAKLPEEVINVMQEAMNGVKKLAEDHKILLELSFPNSLNF